MTDLDDDERRAALEQTTRQYARYDSMQRDRIWTEANPGFRRLASDRTRELRRLVRASAVPGRTSILDLGCGDGRLATAILPDDLPIDYVGLDLLEDRIASARAASPERTFHVASADAVPASDGTFDVVIAATLFSSIPSTALEDRVANEVARVLRPAGWLIWYDIRRDNPWNRAVHGISGDRIAELFPGWRIESRSFTVAPPLARRLGVLTPTLYPLLHAIPLLRSNLIGRLQKPSRQSADGSRELLA